LRALKNFKQILVSEWFGAMEPPKPLIRSRIASCFCHDYSTAFSARGANGALNSISVEDLYGHFCTVKLSRCERFDFGSFTLPSKIAVRGML